MSESDSINGTLILTSELKSCGLRDLQIKISDFLENRRAVKQVRKCKTNNGEVIPGKFEVDLQNTEDVQRLINEEVLYLEHNDTLYSVEVTRAGPRKEPNRLSTDQFGEAEIKSSKKFEPSRFSQRDSSSSENESSSSSSEYEDVKPYPVKEIPPKSSKSKVQNVKKPTTDKSKSLRKSEKNRKEFSSNATNWHDLLQSEPSLFDSRSDSCVLVQCESENISEEDVLAEVQSRFLSNEVVKSIKKLKDGFFLVFISSIYANEFLKLNENCTVTINECELQIYKKPIPAVYKDRFLLQGNFRKNSKSEAEEILSGCTKVSLKVNKMKNSSKLLVVFDKETQDVNKLQREIKKLRLHKIDPKIIKVCRTDCIQVQNLEDVNNEKIRLSFLNKKYGNGDVTWIERDEKNKKVAYVYFADYTDAETFEKKAKERGFSIQGSQVDVSLYWPGINGSVDHTSFKLHHFYFSPNVDSDVVKFVRESRDIIADFYKRLGDLAIVEIGEDQGNQDFRVKVNPIQKQMENDSDEIDQEKFEDDCRNRIQDFFKKFKSHLDHFSDDDIERVRRENEWQDEEVFVEKTLEGNKDIKVLIRWNIESRKNIKVVGFRSDVEKFIDWFKTACDQISQSEKFSKLDYEILINCGIVEEVSSFFDNFEPQFLKDNLLIKFSGSKFEVKQAVASVNKKLKEIQECDLTFLDSVQLEFLNKLLENKEAELSDIEEYIQEKITENRIRVSLVSRGRSLYLKYDHHKINELERAKEEIQKLFKMEEIPVDGPFDEMMEDEEWKTTKDEIESSGKLCVIENRRASTLALVGLPSNFSSGIDKITKYLEENVEIEKTVNLSYAKAHFITSFDSEVGADEQLANVDFNLETGGIHVKGRALLVRKAVTWIEKTAQTISTAMQDLYLPGISTFLRSDSGRQFIKSTSKNSTCIITLDRPEPEKWTEARKATGSELHEEESNRNLEIVTKKISEEKKGLFAGIKDYLGSLFLTPQEESSVEVNVVGGNILNSKCDVMVNTVGDEFNLTLSRVSSALIAIAGESMVKECEENPLYKSEIYRVTKAPKTNFKNVVHLVTPNSPEMIAKYLLKAFELVEKKLKLKSIAVPAIGTGQFGMTDVEVAKSVRAAVDLFRKSGPQNLKQIDIVIFEKKMLPAFKNALTGSKSEAEDNASTSPQSSPAVSLAPVQTTIQSGTVSVKFGDILKSNCDVIFNTVGIDFNLNVSQVSKAITTLAGKGIQTECGSASVLQNNACRITSGGNSRFKNIVHFITPKNPNDISKNLEDVLKFIDQKLNVNSVAIPAIGTGNANLEVDDVAKAFATAISNFFSTNPNNLTTIDVVIFQKKDLRAFQTNIVPVPSIPNTQAPVTKVLSKPKTKLFSVKSRQDPNHKVTFYFTSNQEENMHKAWELIRRKAESKCTKKMVKDDVLEFLDDEDRDELMAVEREFNVSITTDDHDEGNQFFILGLKNSVTDAFTYTLTLLQRYNKAVTSADYVSWMYEDPNTKTWIKHPLLANLELESSFKEDNTRPLTLSMKINKEKTQFHVDFATMIQTSQKDQSQQTIKRFTLSGNNNIPTNWDGKKSRQLVTLNPQDQEYVDVLNEFQKSLPSLQVVRLDRVENKRLFTQFQAQKQEVEDRMKSNNVNFPVTRRLFHGTSHDVIEKIYKGGFNRSYAGKNAVVYGNGVYFALDSNYSNSYASPSSNGDKQMFLVDVITGEFTQGTRGMIDAPSKSGGSSSDLYDCVVDKIANPTIFVVFKDASAYPLYLLTYR